MNPKLLLSDETITKREIFMNKIVEKIKTISGLEKAKSMDDLMNRSVDRGLSIIPIVFAGVAATDYVLKTGSSPVLAESLAAFTQVASTVFFAATFLDLTNIAIKNIKQNIQDSEDMSNVFSNIDEFKNKVSNKIASFNKSTEETSKEVKNKIR